MCSGKVAEAFWFWEELKVFKIKGTLLVEGIGKKDEEKDSTSATKEMEQSGEEEHASASDLEKYTRRRGVAILSSSTFEACGILRRRVVETPNH